MNISGTSVPVVTTGDSAEALSASMSKKQQLVEGKIALDLIQSAAAPAQAQPVASSPTANLGNHIDVYV